MAREPKDKEIDGMKFTVQMMPVKRAIKMLHKLARAGLPAMLKAVGESKLEGESLGLADLDLSNLGEAAAMLFEKFSDADLDHCMSELLETAVVEAEGKTTPVLKALDTVITNPLTMFKAMAFALEVNYGNFSDAFRAAAGTLKLGKAAPSSKA